MDSVNFHQERIRYHEILGISEKGKDNIVGNNFGTIRSKSLK